MKSPESRLIPLLLFLITGLFTVIIYYPGLAGDYMFDDMPNLLLNSQLDIDSPGLDSLQDAAFSSGAGMLRRPVSMASFALNRYFFGIDPYSHKVVNLIIHLLTGLTLFVLSRLVVRSYRQYRDPHLSAAAANWIPVVVCGLWLVHPLNLTSVLYIVQRMTSLSALFTAVGLCLYVTGRRRMLNGRHGLSIIVAGLLVFGGLAALSKENGILLPLYMLVLEITLFRFLDKAGHPDRTMISLFTIVVALPGALFLLYNWINPLALLNFNGRDFTLSEHVLTEARVLVFYLRMIIMPSIRELGLYHDDIALSHGLLDPVSTLYSLLALAGMLAGSLLLIRKRPLVSLGILWFFAGHVLESTIFPLEIAHEHRNYLADYGILLAATSALAQAPIRRLAGPIKIAAPALFFLLFSYTTWLRSEQWSDNINHAIYEARHHPESPRAVFAAGRIHARLAVQGGQPDHEDKAFDYLERAGELDSSGIMPNVTLVKLSYLTGRPVDPIQFDRILDKLSRYPVSSSDIISLQALAECAGDQCKIPHEIMDALFDAALKQESVPLLMVYGYYKTTKQGDARTGLKAFSRAVELDPQQSQHWLALVNLLVVMGEFDEAEKRLAQFKATEIHGSGKKYQQIMQNMIDEARKAAASPAGVNVENG
jgi:tetratricopeptide (TPR) repeat protein